MFENNTTTDTAFWRLILASWSMGEIHNLAGFAADVERCTQWSA